MKYYLGIDGGGTKTTAVICDENCNFISSFVGESINFNSVGTKTARENHFVLNMVFCNSTLKHLDDFCRTLEMARRAYTNLNY